MEHEQEIIQNSLLLFDTQLSEFSSFGEFRKHLIALINDLVNHNFQQLLFLLYRIDVHEEKVRHLIALHQGEKAPELIADLIIERQQQKIITRQQFKSQQQVIEDDACEAW